MGLSELFTAVLLVGISLINAAIPAVAFRRSRDGRFLLLSAASLVLAILGGFFVWGAAEVSAPSWTVVSLPILVGLLVVAGLLLVATLWPRRV